MEKIFNYLEYFRKTSLISETKNYKDSSALFWVEYESNNFSDIYVAKTEHNILKNVKKDMFSNKNRKEINSIFYKEIKDNQPIKVLVSPFPFSYNNSLCHPILIPVEIFNIGFENREIFFKPYNLPIISRDMLAMFSGSETGKIFDEEELNIYLKKKAVSDIFKGSFDGDEWNNLMNYYVEKINDFSNVYDLNYIDKIYFFEESLNFNFYQNYEKVIKVLKEDSDLVNELTLFDKLTQNNNFNNIDYNNIYDLSKKLESEKSVSFLGQVKINSFNGNYFSLNLNQRIFLNSIEGEQVVALNGPPGTGKTTALQSVIATKIVSAFLEKKDMPIIFGVSSTNQAKNNIIDGFKHSEIHDLKNESTLFKRWIDLNGDDISYGISLKGSDIVLSDYDKLISEKSLECIKEKYLNNYKKFKFIDIITFELLAFNEMLGNEIQFKNYFDKDCDSIQKVKNNLYNLGFQFKCLLDIAEKNKNDLIGELRTVSEFYNIEYLSLEKIDKLENFNKGLLKKFLDLFNENKGKIYTKNNISVLPKNVDHIYKEYCDSIKDKKTINVDLIYREFSYIIDNFFKPVLFHLAMRYYEGVFIEELELHLNKKRCLKNGAFKESFKMEKYHFFSNISPVFVSTMDGLPNAMYSPNYRNINKKKDVKPIWETNDNYLFNFIDYLIVDEAGQCNSDKGAINFTFAKNAIIVGDTDQIEPVFSLDDIEDYNSINHSLEEKIEYEDFILQPYNSHNGNVMKMAQNASNYAPYFNNVDNLSKGLYLLEHRRCRREVIEYCNELIYGGKLIYPGNDLFCDLKESDLYLKDQKPWGFINVEGNAEKIGSSNINKSEAKRILEWIDENYIELTSKGKKLKDIIAILTCFSAQEKVIRKEIYSMKFKNISIKDLKGITIGTAHKLQGAERPIILFSFVYDKKSIGKLNFIDKNKNIINVAVSRSKQSFYVFGNADLLSNAPKNTATGILWKYLTKNK